MTSQLHEWLKQQQQEMEAPEWRRQALSAREQFNPSEASDKFWVVLVSGIIALLAVLRIIK